MNPSPNPITTSHPFRIITIGHVISVYSSSTQSLMDAIHTLRQDSPVYVDWVLLGFKSNILDQEHVLYTLLQPFLSPMTRILAIMNGFVDSALVSCIEQQSVPQRIPQHPFLLSLTQCAAVYAGMAFICCNRIQPGHVHHTFSGRLTTSLTAIHIHSLDRETLLQIEINRHSHAIESFFSYTSPYFETCYIENLIQARWTKNLWNLPFNGISVAMGGITTDCIVNDLGLRQLAITIMEETISIANQDLSHRGFSADVFLGDSEVCAIVR